LVKSRKKINVIKIRHAIKIDSVYALSLDYQFFLNIISLTFGFIFLFPIRLALIITILPINYLIIEIIYCIAKFKNSDAKAKTKTKEENPTESPNEQSDLIQATQILQIKPKVSLSIRKLTFYIVYWTWRFCLFLSGVYWIEIKDLKNLDSRARILIYAPHTSVLDGVPLELVSGRPYTGLSSITNYKIPFVGRILRLLEFAFTDPDNKSSKKNAIETIKHRATSEYWQDCTLVFSPEGTTSNGTNLCQFKKGAFLPNQPLQSFEIEYPEWFDRIKAIFCTRESPGKNSGSSANRRNTRGSGWMAYTYDSNFLLILYHLCCIWQPMIVRVLPIYEPCEGENENDAEEFILNVRKLFSQTTGLSCHNTNRLDAMIVSEVDKLRKAAGSVAKNTDADEYLIYGGDLEEKYGRINLNVKEIIGMFRSYLQFENKNQKTFEEYVKDQMGLKGQT